MAARRRAATSSTLTDLAGDGTPAEGADPAIIDIDVDKELADSYMEYALSVIISRAIPDARDGLKPVQRRIVYAMLEGGLRSDRPYRKAISAVGDTMKKYHPHGDCLDGATRIYALDGTTPTLAELTARGVDRLDVLAVTEQGATVAASAHSFRIGQMASRIFHVHLADGTTVTATGNHPFLTVDGVWVRAEDLPVGTALRSAHLSLARADLELSATAGGLTGPVSPSPVIAAPSRIPSVERRARAADVGARQLRRALPLDDAGYEAARQSLIVEAGQGAAHSPGRSHPRLTTLDDNVDVPCAQIAPRYPNWVVGVTVEELDDAAPMYDFTVDDHENLFVVAGTTDNGLSLVCVHNSAIYETLVRMAQHWSLRVPLVDGHGNFGSLDDGPAAARYCVTGDTRVRTAYDGSRRIEDLAWADPNSTIDIDIDVIGAHGEIVHASKFHHSGNHPTLRLTTEEGYELTGTGNHPVVALATAADGTRTHQWKLLSELAPGDIVAIAPQLPEPHGSAGQTAVGDASALDGAPETVWRGGAADKVAYLTVDGVGPRGYKTYSAPSERLARDIQALLLEVGVVSRRIDDGNGWWTVAVVDPGDSGASVGLGGSYYYATVADVVDAGVQAVYSLRVDTSEHAFVTDGFVSHNTEARLAPAAEALLADVEEDTVDLADNFDGSAKEPTVLPAGFPSLLVNGATGIAVGMATNMAPHNLIEVVNACKHLLEHPDASLADLMVHIPAPDFPTGGEIYNLDGITDAYRTGRGAFRLRAKVTVGDVSPRRRGLVVTELPYTVGPERVITRIKELVAQKKLDGISDLKDLSDRKRGLNLVIEAKAGVDPEALLAQLYKLTPLEEGFSINAVALVGGKPETCSLHTLIRAYLDHRIVVIQRRTRYRLTHAEARAHIVEGLLVALATIDEVVAIIRACKDTDSARKALRRKLTLSEVQASHILEMPLRRLTSLEVGKLKDELAELAELIGDLTDILATPQRQRGIVASELDMAAGRLGTPRRTKILSAAPAAVAPKTVHVADEPCTVAALTGGNLLRVDDSGTKPRKGAPVLPVVSLAAATTRSAVGAVTSAGRLLRIPALELASVDAATAVPKRGPLPGTAVSEFSALTDDETLVAVVPLDSQRSVAVITAQGVVKRVAVEAMPNDAQFAKAGGDGVNNITLRDGDRVVGASVCADADHMVAITAAGQLLRFEAVTVRPQGRPAGGVAGMRVADDDHVLAFATIPADAGDHPDVIVTGTDNNNVKVSAAHDFPVKGRGTGGVRCMTFKKGDTKLLAAYAGPNDWAAITADNLPVDMPVELARRDASGVPAADLVAAFVRRAV